MIIVKSKELTLSFSVVDPTALDILMNYNWPGNIREFENMIERLVVFSVSDTIMPDDLPLELRDTVCKRLNNSLSYSEAKKNVIDEFNRNFISCALKETSGNVTKAAEKLKLDRANLQSS